MRVEEYIAPVSEDSSSHLIRLRLSFKTAVRLSSLAARRAKAQAEGAGLLFGTVEDGLVNVIAFRSLAFDVPYAPALPVNDIREAASTCLAASRFDPEIASLQPVGWYRLHLDGSPDISLEELAFHNQISSARTFTALFLLPAGPGLLAGSVFGNVDGEDITPTDQRRGSLNISIASVGIEAVEVSIRSTAADPGDVTGNHLGSRSLRSWLFPATAQLQRTWLQHPGVFTALAASLGFLLGLTASSSGFAPFYPSQSATSKSQRATKAPPFTLQLKRQGADVLVTWMNGVKSPTLAYLTISDQLGTTNLNLTPIYHPNGMFLISGRHGHMEASLSLSDGLDTVQQKATLASNFPSGTEAATAVPSRPTVQRELQAANSEAVARLETRNRRLEALITVLQQRLEEKSRVTPNDAPGK